MIATLRGAGAVHVIQSKTPRSAAPTRQAQRAPRRSDAARATHQAARPAPIHRPRATSRRARGDPHRRGRDHRERRYQRAASRSRPAPVCATCAAAHRARLRRPVAVSATARAGEASWPRPRQPRDHQPGRPPARRAISTSRVASPSGQCTSRPSAAKNVPKVRQHEPNGVLELGLRDPAQRTVQQHPQTSGAGGRHSRAQQRGRGASRTRGQRRDDQDHLDALQQHPLEGDRAAGPVWPSGRGQVHRLESLALLHELGKRGRAGAAAGQAKDSLPQPFQSEQQQRHADHQPQRGQRHLGHQHRPEHAGQHRAGEHGGHRADDGVPRAAGERDGQHDGQSLE